MADRKTNNSNALATSLLAILIALVIALPVRGWAIHLVWGWFAVPLGAPVVSASAGLGLSFLAMIMRPPDRPTQLGDSEGALYTAAYGLVSTLVGLAAAFALHLIAH